MSRQPLNPSLDNPNNIWLRVQIMNLMLTQYFPVLPTAHNWCI